MQSTRQFEFIALVALLTAMVAMSIDTMLPAMGEMARELGAVHSNDRQYIILGFFAGMMLGTLLFGPFSDAVGRKPAIFLGLVFFVVGALMCAFATSFPILILGRAVQGFGAASPRVVGMAMVRDGAAGNAMARVMSFVMSVFMLVPIVAPSLGQLALFFVGWRWIFAAFIFSAIIAALWLALRQPETLPPDRRIAFSATKLAAGAAEVIRHPISLGYTLAVGAIFAAFTTYLGTTQQIFAEQYHLGPWFSVWFGCLAIAIAIAMIVNGRLVMRLGMRTLSKWALRGYIVTWVLMSLFCLLTSGHPPLPLVGALFFFSFFCSGIIFGNYNAMAMEPMGHIAGMASAITGSLSTLVAVIFGAIAGGFYNDTLTPLALTFALFGFMALAASEWAERQKSLVVTKTAL